MIAWVPAVIAVALAVAFPRPAWRWLTGLPMDGPPGRPRYRTDASWNLPATKRLHPIPVIAWYWWARRVRAAIRGGGTLGFLAVVEGLLVARTATLIALAAALAVALWLAYGRARSWRHRRDVVRPLDAALPPAVTVRSVARDRSRTVLALPPGLGADDKDKKMILQTVTAVLGAPAALEAEWSLLRKRPEAVITLNEPPPGMVRFADIRAVAAAADWHEIILGLARKAAVTKISISSDSPHLGLSAPSGEGKSVTARNAAAQLAHHGSITAVLDSKLMSHHWAAGLPNVAYARSPAEIHALAMWLAAEVDRRNKVALYSADVEGVVHGDVGPPVIAILEELNVTQAELAAYWKEIGGKGRSPAVAALDKVSFAGRQVRVHLVYIGQRLSAKATSGGSGDARENIGVLLMANPAASTWKMLVGDRHALPPGTDVKGRWQVVTAKAVTEVQTVFITGREARDWAMSGTVAVPRWDMPCVGGLAPVGTPERDGQGVPDMTAIEGNGPDLGTVPDSPVLAPLTPTITIREALDEGISGPTYDAVRKALSRALSAPEPVGRRTNGADEYDRVEWCDWEELRRQPRKAVRP